jgi:hypothetical protein
MKDKMGIWNAVCITDPKYTKKVNQRGGFTAIDAQYQIQTATEMFGAFGMGWGVKDETFNIIDSMVIYQAILWYVVDGVADENEIPIHSSLAVKPDCIKSVATDALTKGLSKLGFNADVFLGKFDDNKYVQEQNTINNDDGSGIPNGEDVLLWPYGKHKNKPITALPNDYCEWALENLDALGNNTKVLNALKTHMQSFS